MNPKHEDPTAGASAPSPTRDKAIRLLHYLREYVRTGIRVIRRVDQYATDGTVLWLHKVPRHPGCISSLWTAPGPATSHWLEVHKQQLPRVPALPLALRPWVSTAALERSDGPPPTLNERAVVTDRDPTDGEERTREQWVGDHPEVRAAYDQYLSRWSAWAADYEAKAPVQRLYGELFAMYQAHKRMGEAFELVMGLGLLTWQDPQGQEIRRHLVVARAELSFDEKRGVFVVDAPPPPEGAALQLEDEFIEPTDRPTQQYVTTTQGLISESGDDPLAPQLTQALITWTTSLHPDASWQPRLDPRTGSGAAPMVDLAPALILRKRTSRSLLRTYDQLISQIEAGSPVPFGLARLVEPLDDHAPASGGRGAPPTAAGGGAAARAPLPADGEVYFPLPTNEEQRRILRELERRRGVLVQGPPGTGKSHTIANLIAHCLATGQRILVTSETPRALSVLKAKLPEAIQPLCVSLLGADTGSYQEMARSVTAIGLRHKDWSPDAQQRRITELEAGLQRSRGASAQAQAELRTVRESETLPVSIAQGAYRGTAAQIARRIADERPIHGWLTLADDAPEMAPVTGAQALRWLETMRALPEARREEILRHRIPTRDLPGTTEVTRMLRDERAAEDALAAHGPILKSESMRALRAWSPVDRSGLLDAVRTASSLLTALSTRTNKWLPESLDQLLAGRHQAWLALHELTTHAVGQLTPTVAKWEDVHVRGLENRDRRTALSDARTMLDHLTMGGRWSRLGFVPADVKPRMYLKKEVTVDGQPAETIDVLETLVGRLEAEETLARAWTEWTGRAAPATTGLRMQLAELVDHCSALEAALKASDAALAAERSMLGGAPALPMPDWRNGPTEVVRAGEALKAEEALAVLVAARQQIEDALRAAATRPNAHEVLDALRRALEARDADAWVAAWRTLAALEQDSVRLVEARSIETPMRAAAPDLVDAIVLDLTDPAWGPRLERLEEAWRFADTVRWLRRRNDPQRQERLRETVALEERAMERQLGELAAERAWQAFLSRLTQKEREAIQGWQFAVKKVGKGTGKNAERYRAEARSNMSECVGSIPAWIMPRYRVSETLEVAPELFDVVIVDEASQTGVDGLFLYYLGKKVVVVGDDQQISPSGVGVNTDQVNELQRRYLDGIPFHAALGPTSSLYDHAQIRFAGKIVLREHFRCMPEIIEFSNKLCYAPLGTPLVPLRTYPPSRLDPLISCHVGDGFQTGASGRTINRPEALAIADQIEACLRDPRYATKSFGVISLLGEAQARVVHEDLVRRVGPEMMEERQIVCGDSYAFQGDERDVIFLSMVSAPNERFATMTTSSAVQRFNVAGSRARDQLWLFHSVTLDHLGASCVRRQLLSHFHGITDAGREVASDAFESDFERDVCMVLRGRGYRVLTQVSAGDQTSHRFRIDLVVQGTDTRLAVECDGDRWHGLDRYEADMVRQRQLERAGWIFARVRASAFYWDAEAAMGPVWRELERLGITPPGTLPSLTASGTDVAGDEPVSELGSVESARAAQGDTSPDSTTTSVALPTWEPDPAPSDQEPLEFPDSPPARGPASTVSNVVTSPPRHDARTASHQPPPALRQVDGASLSASQQPELDPSSVTFSSAGDVLATIDELVLECVRHAPNGASKSEILAATQMPESMWQSTIKRLEDRKAVTRAGERRGARYYPPGEAPDRSAAPRATPSRSPRANEDDLARVRALIRGSAFGVSKGEVLDAIGLDESSWRGVIEALQADESVFQVGNKRGARYFWREDA
ncbi:MAG: hypothetical protein AMXMBFR64_61710 [Myxococcales bacterium]